MFDFGPIGGPICMHLVISILLAFVACVPLASKIFANKIRFLAQAESLISVRGIGESFGHARN